VAARGPALVLLLSLTLACGGEIAQGPSYVPSASHSAPSSVSGAPPADGSSLAKPADQPGTSPAIVPATTGAAVPAAVNSEPPPLWNAIPIADPGHALAAFYAALQRAERGEGQARIAFYGASHTADDMYTGPLRQRLQQRFGEAGPGFVALGKPWKWYRHAGIKIDVSKGFKVFRIRARDPQEGVYGLAGFALDSGFGKPARAVVATHANGGLRGTVSSIELFYLEQPNGGHFTLFIDGARAKRVSTNGRVVQPGYLRLELKDAQHTFDLRTEADGRVRIFGAALERAESGVILDTLGVPGTRVRDHLYWNDAVYREHLARRKPDMVVLAYGTNESGDDDVSPQQYEDQLRRVLARVREVAPNASCLLIGPSDRPLLDEATGEWGPRPLTDAVIDVQKRVSADLGCGFFDVAAFMGGQLSMLRWIAAQPPLGTADHVHFTAAGYTKMAEVLHDALLAGYEPAAAPAPAPTPTSGKDAVPLAAGQAPLRPPVNAANASSNAL
jgi:lysophospholipase L1-like esterase